MGNLQCWSPAGVVFPRIRAYVVRDERHPVRLYGNGIVLDGIHGGLRYRQ